MFRFTDKVVLITGGGSGLGRAAAIRLATEGAKLSLVDISVDGLDSTREAIESAQPDAEIVTTVADVSQPEDVERYVSSTIAAYGRIDGFFNNAGIEGKHDVTEDYDLEQFERVLAINLTGAFLGLKAVLRVMREQGSGYIVNTSSVSGIRGGRTQSGYAAAKHGIVGLTRNSAMEYGRHGIRINAIAPGAIWTPLLENSMRQIDPDNPRKAADEYIQINPTRQYGEAEDVASVVAFLLSDDARYIHASVIPIDGGQSAQY